MDVIARFEDIDGAKFGASEAATPTAQALAAIESEIDEMAKATFRSITLETMVRLIERRARKATAHSPSR
jgi:hypothetical protein